MSEDRDSQQVNRPLGIYILKFESQSGSSILYRSSAGSQTDIFNLFKELLLFTCQVEDY